MVAWRRSRSRGPTDGQRVTVGAAASELDRLREGWPHPPGISAIELRSRTLTNLPNDRPAWLAQVHDRLDQAAFDAYGWPNQPTDDETVERMLALTLARPLA